MVAGGLAMLLLGIIGWIKSRRETLLEKSWYLKAMVVGIAMPFIANTAGWIMAELGRQPWVVFGVMRTEAAVSPTVTAGELLFSLISFSTIYAVLAGVCVYLFVKVIRNEEKQQKGEPDRYDPFDKEEYHAVAK